jgi:hypothetical protein
MEQSQQLITLSKYNACSYATLLHVFLLKTLFGLKATTTDNSLVGCEAM